MRDYSVSGDFGKVKFFNKSIPTNRFTSINCILSLGWHRVNSLYKIQRLKGSETSLILFTVAGNGEVRVGEKKYNAKNGSVIILPKNVMHYYGGVKNCEWEFFWIHYYGKIADLLTCDVVKNNNYYFDIGEKEIEYLLSPILKEDGKSNLERELCEHETIQNVLQVLLKKSVFIENYSKVNTMVADVMNFLDECDEKEFCLDELVNKYHYSKEYIIRTFTKTFAVSPYQYWLASKLKRSCGDLHDNKLTIEEIAKKYGYKSVSNYSKQFKKQFLISPIKYRNLFLFF